jgi:hypothetical protein
MFRKPFGMSLAVLALTGRVSSIQLNQQLAAGRTLEEELENDNGDDYMAESIKEAEKEVSEKRGSSVDMQKEI